MAQRPHTESGSREAAPPRSRQVNIMLAVIAPIWLFAAWVTLADIPDIPAQLCALPAALVLSFCILTILTLNARLREARQAEQHAAEMYSLVSQALEAMPISVQIKDADLRYVWINPEHEKRTGISPDQLLGRTAAETDIDPELATAVMAHDQRVLASGKIEGPEEQVLTTRDGGLKHVSLITKVPLLRDGRVTHIVTIAADLHLWQEAQIHAEDVRRLLETVLNAAPIGIHVNDREGRFRWANKAFCETIGWRVGSPVGKTWEEIAPFIDPVPRSIPWELDLLAGRGTIVQNAIHFPATARRSETHLLVTKVPLYNAAGEVDQILTMGTDITALIKAQSAADTATRLVEGILQNVPLSIQVKDTDLRLRWANRAFAEVMDLEVADVLGRTLEDLGLPAQMTDHRGEMDRRVLNSAETIQFEAHRIVNDSESQVIVVKAPMLDAGGSATHVITISTDITELHRLRAEVDEARRRLQAVLDAVPVIILLKDTDRRYVWVNREYELLHAWRGEQVIGRRGEEFMHDKALAADIKAADEALLMTGVEPPPFTQRHIANGGREVYFSMKRLVIRDAAGRIEGILVVGMDVTELQCATTELRRMNEDLEHLVAERAGELAKVNEFVATVVDSAPVPILTFHPDGRIRSWNPSAERVTGFTESEALNASLTELFPDQSDEVQDCIDALLSGKPRSHYETHRKRRDGREIDVLISTAPLRRDDDTIEGGVSIWLDVTAQRKAERQLRQAQKMEAIGQLTGNVAHDFNNLLAVVIGNLDLLLESLPEDAPNRELAADAIDAAERGSALTGRLLAFSRQQTLRPVTICIGDLIGGMHALLKRAVGETIAIDYAVEPGLWLAKADPGQLESAVMNLCVNARDAMASGGRITIEARNVTRDQADAAADVVPGDYVCISVADTGCGIPTEILGQVFEPFFTTKGTGKGSGLGLSIVEGFVNQSGGHIRVDSTVGIGTRISIFLPRASGIAPAETPDPPIVQGHGERILVVEDNPHLRRTSTATVRALGYAVLEAGDAETALALLDAHPETNLLFTDVVLPGGINGFDLAREALRRRPDLAVVFVSGFVDPSLVPEPRREHGAGSGTEILIKPFRRSDLAARLRSALTGAAETVC